MFGRKRIPLETRACRTEIPLGISFVKSKRYDVTFNLEARKEKDFQPRTVRPGVELGCMTWAQAPSRTDSTPHTQLLRVILQKSGCRGSLSLFPSLLPGSGGARAGNGIPFHFSSTEPITTTAGLLRECRGKSSCLPP